jgi:hypothetical protein
MVLTNYAFKLASTFMVHCKCKLFAYSVRDTKCHERGSSYHSILKSYDLVIS